MTVHQCCYVSVCGNHKSLAFQNFTYFLNCNKTGRRLVWDRRGSSLASATTGSSCCLPLPQPPWRALLLPSPYRIHAVQRHYCWMSAPSSCQHSSYAPEAVLATYTPDARLSSCIRFASLSSRHRPCHADSLAIPGTSAGYSHTPVGCLKNIIMVIRTCILNESAFVCAPN